MHQELVSAVPNLFHSPAEDVIPRGRGRAFADSMNPEDAERIHASIQGMSDQELNDHVDAITAGTNQPL